MQTGSENKNLKMTFMKRLLTLFTLITFSFIALSGMAQTKAYDIKVKLRNYTDNSLMLVTYYGSTNKIVDTAYVNKSGIFEFKGDKPLVGGIYLVVLKNKTYFEILVDKDQTFSLETDKNDMVGAMKVKGSTDNSEFYALMHYMNELSTRRQALEVELKAAGDDEAKRKEIEEKIKAIGKEADEYKIKYMEEHPNTLFTMILKASKEPEIPKELPLKEDGTPDSSYIYKYYRAHFFDNFDFADERLLHTRIYAEKIKKYWTKIIPQNPDTLTNEAIRIIELSKPNKETYKFTIWYFTYTAETSNIMGMDAVFVALAKKYYLTGEAWWVSDKVLENMQKRVNTLEKLLIGKKAPNMIMQNPQLQLVSMYDIQARYTLILFWDPDCGHCRHEIPRIKKWMDENGQKYDVKIYSVCSDTSMVKWTKSIKEFGIEDWINVDGPRSITPEYHDLYDIISTPTIYLLDKDKKIIAKRLSEPQVAEFIERDYKNNYADKSKKTPNKKPDASKIEKPMKGDNSVNKEAPKQTPNK
jgi:thiol-disulfide isomerase/thioredoxin